MVLIIDYGSGNLASVHNSICYLGFEVVVSSHISDIDRCNSVILPGVGDGAYMMQRLQYLRWSEAIQKWVDKGNPLLGICVGAQVLLSFTDEGNAPCLDIISGSCKKFVSKQKKDKIPHMGWNNVHFIDESIPLLKDIQNGAHMYFVHSYYLSMKVPNETLAYTDYIISFSSIITKESVFGVQFHPEKSGKNGLQLLHNFLSYY